MPSPSPLLPPADVADPGNYDWQAIWQLVKRYKRQLIFANILAFIAGIAGIPTPMLIASLVDQVALQKPGEMIGILSTIIPTRWQGPVVFAVAILAMVLMLRATAYLGNLCQIRIFTIVGKQLSADLRQWLFTTLQRQPLEVFESLGSGRVVNHFTTDIETIEKFFSKVLGTFIYSLLLGSGVILMVLWINWKLMLLMLIVNALVLYIGKHFGRRVREYRRQENQTYGDFQGNLTETLDALPELRAGNLEQRFFGRMRNITGELCRAGIRTSWMSELSSRTSQLCMGGGFDIFRCVAIVMVVVSNMSLGEVFAVFAYLWILMGAMDSIIGAQQELYSAKASLQRLDEFARHRSNKIQPARERTVAESPKATEVRFDRVSFAFKPDIEVLHAIDLHITPGERVGIVGHSGSGKSTLIQLLLGLHQPNTGEVLIDGETKTGSSLDHFRSNISLVMQFPALMNDSIANNLRMGEVFREDQLWHALELAQLAEDVGNMPQRLDTLIGRNGLKLSGGQRQRIALARVFLQHTSMLILDEATSALDGETEMRLLTNLERSMQGKTVLMVAHRLSTLRHMDRIVVLHRGTIAEQGSPAQLLDQGGIYHKLAHLAGMYHQPQELLQQVRGS